MELDQKIRVSKDHFDRPKQNTSNQDISPSHQHVFEQIVRLIPIGTDRQIAVDLGCHWGRYCRQLAKSYGKVMGFDFAEKAIQTAFQAPHISYRVADLENKPEALAAAAPVDFYLAVGLFEMLKDPAKLCKCVYRYASNGGRLLIVIPNRKSINYRLFKLKYALAGFMTRSQKFYVYNNGIDLSALLEFLKSAQFKIISSGTLVGIPIYLTEHLPHTVQKALFKFDALLKSLLGGSYFWVMAQKEGAN